MNFFTLFSEPAIIIITACFAWFLIIIITNYLNIQYNIMRVNKYLHAINKKELSYRFGQLDEFMSTNEYTTTIWEDFKKALIFPEKLYIASQNTKTQNDTTSDIYLTVDSTYFFNEETLVLSKINTKFIQAIPTLLTGLGPFFTFLKMAIAFASVNLVADENVIESLGGLMQNIRIAALCSVFAVGFSLLFMFIERILYSMMCKKHYLTTQREFIRLFDVVTSEKFLVDLVKEYKLQSVNTEKLFKTLPAYFNKSMTECFSETTVPYLENILYSLNKLNEGLNKGNGGDVVDKLF